MVPHFVRGCCTKRHTETTVYYKTSILRFRNCVKSSGRRLIYFFLDPDRLRHAAYTPYASDTPFDMVLIRPHFMEERKLFCGTVTFENEFLET